MTVHSYHYSIKQDDFQGETLEQVQVEVQEESIFTLNLSLSLILTILYPPEQRQLPCDAVNRFHSCPCQQGG